MSPVTPGGRPIIVHSKLAIIDDILVRVGSANLNNRSTGFDTECDLAIEARSDDERATVATFRNELAAHWIGKSPAELVAAVKQAGSLAGGLHALDGGARLKPLEIKPIGRLSTFIATYHIGDPAGPKDSWAPWARRWALRKQLRRLSVELERVGLEAPADDLSPETV